ncbi:hypothetical protein [Nocardioides sp.]|uniref:hypothetical protein n=1 Tax=Nocardioides sp. TaxID=35761 RepID=UPI003D0CF15D
MADREAGLTPREQALREDLGREYYALVGAVSDFDGRLMIVKGWSVTLSLAALGLGFQTQHYALFGLGALTALGFWFLDLLLKSFQVRYYPRMRDIEYVASQLNSTTVPGIGQVSSPRIDMYWSYDGGPPAQDWRGEEPERLDSRMVHRLVRVKPWFMPQVLLPHWVAIVVGTGLFVAGAVDVPWLAHLGP